LYKYFSKASSGKPTLNLPPCGTGSPRRGIEPVKIWQKPSFVPQQKEKANGLYEAFSILLLL